MRVHEKVSSYLDENGIKHAAVAKQLGIPCAALNALLSGKQTMYAEDLRSICYALNVSASTFIEYTRAAGN